MTTPNAGHAVSARGGRILIQGKRNSPDARGSDPVARASPVTLSALAALRTNWPEYLMEAWGLGVLMLAAAAGAALMNAPGLDLAQLGLAHLCLP